MKTLLITTLFIVHCTLVFAQASGDNFQYHVQPPSCNGNTGKLHIEATNDGINLFPLPWYIEIENVLTGDYMDYDMESSTLIIEDLEIGSYSVVVWLDLESGCSQAFQAYIDNNQVSLSADIKNQCPGDVTSAGIDLHIGQGNYQVEWYVKLPIPFPTPTISIQSHTNVTNGSGLEDLYGINAGTYIVSVTDQNGCAATAQYSVGISDLSMYGDVFSYCDGTGSITAGADGGAPAYQYSWSNGWQKPETQTLNAGTYTVTVTDEDGCTLAEQFTIPDILTVSAATSPVCQPGNGAIALTVSGGRQPYTYLWNNGATTRDISGLDAGTFTVTVTDEDGCSVVETVEVVNSSSPFIFAENFEMVKPSTCDSEDGYISTWRVGNIQGGIHPFTYLWSNGSTENYIGPVSAGTYTLTVTGADGCTCVKEQILEPLEGISIEIEHIIPSCPSQATGSIFLAANQDVIFNCTQLGITLQGEHIEIENLPPGIYCFTFTSTDNQCQVERCYEIKDIAPFEFLDIVQTFIPCKGNNTAKAEVHYTDTRGGVSCIWHHMQSGEIVAKSSKASNLTPGLYSVTLSDKCGNTSIHTIEITDNGFPGITKLLSKTTCILDSPLRKPGSIKITSVDGGSSPYRYLWQHNFSQLNEISTFTSGIYTVTVTDINQCSHVESFQIKKTSSELIADITITDPNDCKSKMTVLNAKIKITSGNPPYQIKLNNQTFHTDENEITLQFNPKFLLDGFWDKTWVTVEITDACGFSFMQSIEPTCQDICGSCVGIILGNLGVRGCAKVKSGYYTKYGYLQYSRFEAVNLCKDQKVEIFNFNTGESHTFNGKGFHKFQDLFYPGWYRFDIKNHTTGCKYSQWIEVKPCTLIKVIFDELEKGGGGSSTDPGVITNPKDCKDDELEFLGYSYDECGEIYVCPKTNTTKRKSIDRKKCSLKCPGEELYKEFEYCPAVCDYEQLGYNGSKQYDTCPSCINPCIITRPVFDPPTCDEIVKDIIFDTIESKHIIFWNDFDSINNKTLKGFSFFRSQNSSDIGKPYCVFNTNLNVDFVRVDNRDNYYVIGKDQGNFYNKYDIEGTLIWSVPLGSFEVTNVIQNNDELTFIGRDMSSNKILIKNYDSDGNLKNSNIISSIDNNITLLEAYKNKYVAYMDTNRTLALYSATSEFNSIIPLGIRVKKIKFRNDEEILVIAELESTVIINGKEYKHNGKTKPIILFYNTLGQVKQVRFPEKEVDITIEHASVNKDEIALYGQIKDYPSDIDSLEVENCNYIWILNLDTISCDTFTPDLTLDTVTCKLQWLIPPTGYFTTLQAYDGQVWYDSYLPTETDSSGVVTCSVQGNTPYRLVQSKPGCPNIISDTLTVLCDTTPCPQISIETAIDTSCYIFQLSHAQNHAFQLSIKTWQTDTLDLQFTDTLNFFIEDSMQVFNYCGLPPEFWCYNYGQIIISCLDCMHDCPPFVYDWSCIPRVSGENNVSSDKGSILFFPNPFTTGINFEITSDKNQQVKIDVLSPIGEKLFSRDLFLIPGKNDYYLQEFEALPPGIYTITLQKQRHKYTTRVIKII